MKYAPINGVEQPGMVHPKASTQGEAAFAKGKDQGDCPYPIQTSPWSRQAWLEGWYRAKRAQGQPSDA